jgi:hypothetical protein
LFSNGNYASGAFERSIRSGGLLIGRHRQDLSAFTFESKNLQNLVVRMSFSANKAHGPLTFGAIGIVSRVGKAD